MGRKSFGLWLEISSSFVKTATYLSRRIFWLKVFFSKELHFQNYFRILSKTFSAICRKTSGRVVKSAFYLSTGKFWENNFFVGTLFNFRIFQTLCWKVLDFIRKSFWPSRQNCNLPVQKNNLRKFSFESFRLFESLLIFYKSFAAILQESFRQVCPNSILPVKRKFLGRFFFKVFLSRYIPILSKNFSDVWQKKLRQGFRNCILPVWSNVSRKWTFSDLILVSNFRLFSKKLSEF